MEDRKQNRRSGEQGFALILAILALMLLTFLGLTLATTTSTELQIATNYRWSQQAQYNAEAGLEAGRVILAQVADAATYWANDLYAARTVAWNQGAAPTPGGTSSGRDYEHASCDVRGGVGYGKVLTNSTVRYENIDTFAGQALNGAFTVWIRRPLQIGIDGKYADLPDNDTVVLVAEGVAPYIGAADAFLRAHQAVRVLETRFNLALSKAGKPCGLGQMQGQEGGSPMGENFNPCAPVTAGPGGSLDPVFGGAGAGGGTFTSTGAQ
jgi:hypothetical protein